jgi:hypothetical protein
MIFSIPTPRFEEIARGLIESHDAGMSIPVPLPVGESQQPDVYRQYIQDLGL